MPKLLVVDDEPDLLRTIAHWLASGADDFSVTTAPDGEQALDLIKRQPVDILLTDVRLPGIDGIELVQRVLAGWPATKVIVMTGLPSPDLQARAIKGGALHFIKKPFTASTLLGVLREAATIGGWSGSVSGLDIFDLTQLLAMTQRSRSVRVRAGGKDGVIVLEDGQLTHATANGHAGADAFYEMVCWNGGTFEDIPQPDLAAFPRNVEVSTAHLILEAARLRDEARAAWDTAAAPAPFAAGLKELLGASGFACDACVLSSDGTILAKHQGRPGARRALKEIANAVRALASSLGPQQVRRILIEDDEETVVLCDVPGTGGQSLLLVTDSGPRMGGVLAEARRLAQALQPPKGDE
jgi:CheY-like chemotaxis protein